MFIQSILEKNPQLDKTWQQVSKEVSDNQRLRLGFWVVLAISLFYIGMLIGDSRDSIEKQLSQSKQRELKAAHLAEESIWIDRAQDAQLLLSQLQLKFNSASTQGVAKATLQGLINDMIKNNALEKIRVRVEDSEDTNIGLPLWTFTVSIDGNLDAKKLEALLYQLSKHQHHLYVENLSILPNLKRFRMNLKYWFANNADLELIRSKQLSQQPVQKNTNTTKKVLSKSEQEKLKEGFPDEIFQ